MGNVDAAKVTYDDHEYNVVKEGLAEILERQDEKAKKSSKDSPSPSSVFYNPIQQFNRDLSVLAIRVFAEDFALTRRQKSQSTNSQPPDKKRKRENDPEGDVPEATKKLKTAGNDAAQSNDAQAVSETGGGQSNAEELANGQENASKSSAAKGTTEPPKPPFRILDALSATGLRALRYSKEIDQVTLVTANDLSPTAVDAIKLHVKHNGLGGKVHPIAGDAIAHMKYISSSPNPLLPDGSRGRYHVIDLDPYGTAAPFLDTAIQAVQDGGLLCVTCTDSAIFASHGYLEKTFALYGGLPIQGVHSHEGGLRLILHAIATSAARYGVAIEPLLSLSIDFYIRVFVRVRRSPMEVKLLGGKTIEVFGCDHGCGSWSIQPFVRTHAFENKKGESTYKFSASQAPGSGQFCQHCGFKTHLAGPMWGGPLHNPYFIQRMIDTLESLDKETYATIPRMEGMLITARDEILHTQTIATDETQDDSAKLPNLEPAKTPIPRLPPAGRDLAPFFVLPSVLSKVIHCKAPSTAAFRSALIKLNYRVTRSHTKSGSIRTDAPWTVIWEVMREWVRQKAPIKEGAIKKGTAGAGIMRHDRSKHNLNALRDEVSSILRQGDDAAEVQSKLQSLLWRLEHKDNVSEPSEPEVKTEEESKKHIARADGKEHTPPPDTSNLDVVFDEAIGKEREGKKIVRYQINPRENWGPLSRARG